MNNDTTQSALPTLVGDVITDDTVRIDNLFADTWKDLKFNSKLTRAGFTKRSGIEITQVVYLLLLWKWLNVSSIAMFCRQALQQFSMTTKDVLYDLLNRESLSWRCANLQLAKEVYQQGALQRERVKVFVLDDSIKTRRGKKMEGVSCHFDHVTNRHVMGQQVLTLGLATENAFLPVDSQIYVSASKAQPLTRPYQDGRSVAAKRYQEATSLSKPEMAAQMMNRAIRWGIEADYVVADAWFGTRPVVRGSLALGLHAILRMKKGNMKYRLSLEGKQHLLNAEELYAHVVKGQWRKVRGLPWKAVALTVELDLSEKKDKQPQWQTVQLLFVRGLNVSGEPEVGKKDWALFLTTDIDLSISKILEIYALRWGVEVYFKEAKQHLGFLTEQTISFASHTASIHLCALRYLMLVHYKLNNPGSRIADARSSIQDQLNALSFAARLWALFRAVIHGTLTKLQDMLNCSTEDLLQAIDHEVNEFFVRSLQLDVHTMRLEFE